VDLHWCGNGDAAVHDRRTMPVLKTLVHRNKNAHGIPGASPEEKSVFQPQADDPAPPVGGRHRGGWPRSKTPHGISSGEMLRQHESGNKQLFECKCEIVKKLRRFLNDNPLPELFIADTAV